MPTAFVPVLCLSAALGEFTETWISSGPRLLYAFRLTGAILVATLVQLLIDRRARHH